MKKKRYPNNGMVDSFGQLTALGRSEVERFRQKYPAPIAFLKAKYKKLAGVVERHIAEGHYSREDFDGAVWQHVSMGVRSFNPDAGSVMMTYLCNCIRSAAIKLTRKVLSTVRTTSIHAPCGDGDDPTDFLSVTPDTKSSVNLDKVVEPWGQFTARWNRLTEVQKVVLTRRYMDGATLNTISLELDCSRERVRQIQQVAIARLKGHSPKVDVDNQRVYQVRKARIVAQNIRCVAGCGRLALGTRGLCTVCCRKPEIRDRTPVLDAPCNRRFFTTEKK